MGRGGRIHIDRIGFGKRHLESHGGKSNPTERNEYAIKRFKYDSDEMSEEEDIDDMQDRYDKSYANAQAVLNGTDIWKNNLQVIALSMSATD